MTKGIDVSVYQSKVDYKKVKSAGIDFVIIRAGYGKMLSQKDPMFENHYKAAKAAGLEVGAYWYSYATSAVEAKKEAQACLTVLQGKQFEYPIFYDIEEQRTFKSGETSDIASVFCSSLENAGYFAGIYMSRSPAITYLYESVRKRYALWLAEYGNKLNYDGMYGVWQYSSSGVINGVKGNVDLDYCYVDYPKAIKAKGLNGYKSVDAATSKTYAYKKGDAVRLSHANLYASASTKKYTRQISGTFYIYDGERVGGRYRITTQQENCGRTPIGEYVTGYVDLG